MNRRAGRWRVLQGFAIAGLLSACSFGASSTERPSSRPTTPVMSAVPTGTSSTRPAIPTIEVPESEGAPFRASGVGPSTITVPRSIGGRDVTAIKVYLICAPARAVFEVRFAGARKFWGACAAQASAASGAFAIHDAARPLSIQIDPAAVWSVAVTSPR